MVVPDRCKTSCLVPVPKKNHPSTHSDYRPVALTSHVMKSLERLVLRHLRTVGWLLVVDFRKQRTRLNSVTIRGTEVDIVDSYKYLGVHLDNKLD
ncbi:hypothetical protein L3Q82_002281 [Scortum barcoo]|uniref:Uncharacterized protein n=1 Tax=Scortum barcoo TaxID=214431 RepID=A0ACB8VZ98_9TELE|nr:hypothetical protein L3Q82_002281 [Scortum barcoo]